MDYKNDSHNFFTVENMMFACIILAAGEGSRIGKCKAALPFADGETLLSHIISTYINSKVDNILIITGYWEKETVEAAQNVPPTVKFVKNDNPKLGMFSSVCKGVSLLDGNTKYFFVHPVDIPLVKEETVLRLKNAILDSKNDKAWTIPECKNVEGHPVVVSSSLIPELLCWSGENGLRGFLSSQKNNKVVEHVNDEGTIFDIDCWEDYLKLVPN